jgi:DNA gyrase inhibitor GyrI
LLSGWFGIIISDMYLPVSFVFSDWLDKSKKTMRYFFCYINLSIKLSNLEEHALKHACTITEPTEADPLEYKVNGV